MIRVRSAIALFALSFAVAACPGDESGDGGGADPDGSALDLGSRDVYDGGSRDRDEPDGDADTIDTGEDGGIIVDSGESGLGESCNTALDWRGNGVPFTGNTTLSVHREQLTCAGSGGAANAPEVWWKLELAEKKSVMVELGTNGWDGVLAVRTGTCTIDVESCADRPTVLELPSVEGSLYVAVDGFSTGRGFYALSAVIDEPWTIPPLNDACERAEPLLHPISVRGHDFGGEAMPIAPCGLTSAVYYSVDTSGGSLSVLAIPSAAHDVELAVLSSCGDQAIACSANAGRGIAERIDRLAVPSGRSIIAVGTRESRPASGSFTLDVREDAPCVKDAECGAGDACIDSLSCAAELGDTVTSTIRVEIPDGGRIDLPLDLSFATSRVKKVRARVAFDHLYPEDLVIELRSPGPTPIVVRLRDRSAYEADVTYGRERPADGPGQLEDFALVKTATGTWILSVEDRAIGDRGFVTGVVLGVE